MPNLVELPILGVLREQPLHGYELKRRIEGLTGYFGTLSFGSLYPMLRQLEIRGHVTLTKGTQFGRIIHRYRITPKGEERFVQLMHNPSVALTQKLLFFQAISPRDREQILQSHMEECKKKLKKSQLEQKSVDVKTIDRYHAALLAREIDHVAKDVVWLQQLIDDEEANTPERDGRDSHHKLLKSSRKKR